MSSQASNTVGDVLKERAQTHGNFRVQAHNSQLLKEYVFAKLDRRLDIEAPPETNDVIKEAVEMICVKLSRAMCGNPYEPDHYLDIAGYAQLIVNELKK